MKGYALGNNSVVVVCVELYTPNWLVGISNCVLAVVLLRTASVSNITRLGLLNISARGCYSGKTYTVILMHNNRYVRRVGRNSSVLVVVERKSNSRPFLVTYMAVLIPFVLGYSVPLFVLHSYVRHTAPCIWIAANPERNLRLLGGIRLFGFKVGKGQESGYKNTDIN
jgi:hypothetical protein